MTRTANPETTLRMSRRIAADRERVYAALLDANVLQQIWSAEAYTIARIAVDPRVGGGWQMAMRDEATGTENRCSATYLELDPPQRIVWLTKWHDGPLADAAEMRVTLQLSSIGGDTQIDLVHEFFPDSTTRDHHASGWGAGFDRLAALLEGSQQAR
ncbi:MAG: SRPBCC domain-containing protein [Pirellulales bacterium]|nr:SRPBCC domain-containing protein [Pirellulales bacterium]